jgi:cyclic beta-1,2-glucan synthetase
MKTLITICPSVLKRRRAFTNTVSEPSCNGLKFGEHGLPLIGSGDWNDGMNLVGVDGKGESVWLGFFLYDVLMRFTRWPGTRGSLLSSSVARRRRTGCAGISSSMAGTASGTAAPTSTTARRLDRRATPNARLIRLPKAGLFFPVREIMSERAWPWKRWMKRLVRREHGLIQLLDPPFDKSALNPGYIKGYVPGVRENGGQYTHAAIWAAMAFAGLGDNRRAWELFNMINPVNHARSAEEAATYKVEPYVVAADVYAVARILAAAAGLGTRARPPGCTG